MSFDNLELGFSASSSAAAKSAGGLGDINVSAGGAKQTQTLYLIAGVVAVALAVILLFRKQ